LNGDEEFSMKRKAIATDRAPKAFGPYSQAIRDGRTLYVSGQLPVDPATGTLVEGGIREQTQRVIRNLVGIVEAAGGSLESIVKLTFFIADWNDFAAMNDVCSKEFKEPYPARSTLQNTRPMGALVGADAIAVLR
jgi:reactive intermediate/imine deaminase